MTYASILVLLDHDKHYATRLQVAMKTAAQFGSNLTGIVPTGIVDLWNVPQSAASISEYAALAWDALRDRAERLADRYRDECHAAKLPSFDAVVEESDRADSMIRRAHCHDLLVLTQADPSEDPARRSAALVEQCILNSGRPTLILPYGGGFDSIAHKVLVAWDDSREAARAIADALPFLRQAKEVMVVAWNEDGSIQKSTLTQRLVDVCTWLKRHGVTAEHQIEPTTEGIAESMLSRAADWDIDLIVMGAYGHARWAERVLGGATRGLLKSMTVPVLMSH